MTSSTASEPAFLSEIWRKHGNELGLILAITLVLAIATPFAPAYRTQTLQSAHDLLIKTAMLGIFALGAATVIISGGIDLSAGSVIAFSGTLFASVIFLNTSNHVQDLPAWVVLVAVAVTLVGALMIGTFHAWLITVVRLPPFIATLASLVGLRSIAELISEQSAGGTKVPMDKMALIRLDDGWAPVILWILLVALTWFVMRFTVVGRHIYAMGGSEAAAKLSGIRTDKLKWLAYSFGACTSAISGILYTCYVGSVQATSLGVGYELFAIAAAVVGGCSLAGGQGTVAGVMLGAIFLRVVMDVVEKTVGSPDTLAGLVVGVMVVLAVSFNELRGSEGFRKRFFPGWLGACSVVVLSVLGGVVTWGILALDDKNKSAGVAGMIVGVAAFALLLTKLLFERRPSRPGLHA